MKSLLRWLLRIIATFLLICIVFIAVVSFLQLSIPLTELKGPVEALASKALKRPVTIEQSLVISTSLKPTLNIRGLRIRNAEGDEGFTNDTFLYLDLVKFQLELIPLLKRKIHISEIRIEQLDIHLEELENGKVNWVLTTYEEKLPARQPEPASPQTTTDPEKPKFTLEDDTLAVRDLVLNSIVVNYTHPKREESLQFKLEECTGKMIPGKPVELQAKGEVLSFPYRLNIAIASLEDFLVQNRSWLEIAAEIEKTNLTFRGDVNLAKAHQELLFEAAVSGQNLSSLNNLLKVDLPPLIDYGVETRLQIRKNFLKMNSLKVKTGSSALEGDALITRTSDKIEAELNLHSPIIQINDFTFDDWSWSGQDKSAEESGDSETKVAAEKAEKPDTGGKEAGDNTRKIRDPDLLAKVDARLKIQADSVLSGDDQLGKGDLVASLKNGRLSLEKLNLDLPGGSVAMSASVKPGKEKSSAELKVAMQNFDIGILVRRVKPDSKMGGLVNLDVDLKSEASTPEEMLENGEGYFDFSGQLKNMKAGIIDLWAVNLVSAIVTSVDENQSDINCAVCRWSAKDGLLTPDTFFIDTSKIRICGDGQVDLKKRTIELEVAPTAKRPEFFNLATPLKISGTFADIQFGIGGVFSILDTAVNFITSPVLVPIKRVVSKDIPADGGDVCNITLGPGNRKDLKVGGCN